MILDPGVGFVALVIVGLLAIGAAFGAPSRAALLVCSSVWSGSAVLAIVWIGVWSWVLRDGLGPDSVRSSGREAWLRFSDDFLPALAIVMAMLAVGTLVHRSRLGKLPATDTDVGT
jgi:hypothetical protein